MPLGIMVAVAASYHQKQKENDDMDVPGVYCYTAVYTSALWEHKSFMIKQSIEAEP